MASLSSCLSKFGKAIPEGDVADIRAKQQTLMADGVPAEAAAVQAIEAVILEAEADLQTVAEAAKAKGVELTVGRRRPGASGPTAAKPQGVLFKRKGTPAEAADAAKVAEAAREMASPKPAPKPKTFGGTVEEVKRKAMASWGPLIVRLQKAGILNFITTEEARKIDRSIPANPTEGNRVPGFYVNGKAYIVVDQIRQDEVAGVVLHEVGEHYGLRKMVGDELYDRTLALVGRRAGSDPDVKDGMRKAVEAGTSPEHMLQETLAHLIEAKPGHDLATRIIDGIKLWFNRRGKDAFKETEVELLRRMARESLRASARAAPRGVSKTAILFHRAWHGTPHTWENDRADMSKVGTGEGAQVYGYGLYFAGKRAVGEHYKKMLTDGHAKVSLDGNPVNMESLERLRPSNPAASTALGFALDFGGEHEVGVENTIASLRNYDEDAAADWLEANADRVTIEKNEGSLYEVELAPDESDYLDWDKPLSEKARRALRALGMKPEAEWNGKVAYERLANRIARMEGDNIGIEDWNGLGELGSTFDIDLQPTDPGTYSDADMKRIQDDFAKVRDQLSTKDWMRVLAHTEGHPEKVASAMLHAAGIPGIRYRDGSSRGKDGDGSHNYVIFDDSLVEVKARYSKRADFERAGDTVDGRTVRQSVPNMGSIAASLDNYTVLDGVREVPLSAFEQTAAKDLFATKNDRDRVRALASQIEASGEIAPLIVVVDNEGPYVLEGGHRLAALDALGAKSLPAVVVIDSGAMYSKRSEPTNQPQQPSPRKELRQNEREWTANLPRKSQQKAPLFSRRGDANFEQPEDYDFKEADYRKPVVSWAKERLDFTAPNGKPAWQNFVRWFGGSQVVDADGKPLVMYHGTGRDLTVFSGGKGSRPGLHSEGIWFTRSRDRANEFAEFSFDDNKNVMPVFLSIKNPAKVAQSQLDRDSIADLSARGYDGAYDIETGWWIAFRPEQIKSATGNTGDFSANNDIRFSRRGAPDSPQFRLWFGNSKVVDKDGNPLVVYHGTASEFWTFEKEKISSATNHSTSPLGFFFTPDRAKAEHYARNASEGVPADERIVDVYLSIQNPYTMSAEEAESIEDQDEARALVKKLRAQGYDGIRMTSRSSDSWIAFESTQAKSASQNNGEYSRANPDIRRSGRGAPVQTDTPEFKRWATWDWVNNKPGKTMTKVVDGDGKPLQVYHGSVRWSKDGIEFGDVTVFDRLFTRKALGRQKTIDQVGSWFSDTPGDKGAGQYAGIPSDRTGSVIYPVYLSITNPWRPREGFKTMKRLAARFSGVDPDNIRGPLDAEPFRQWLINGGYDGIVFPRGTVDGTDQQVFVALHPEQVKSSIGNTGEWNPRNALIWRSARATDPAAIANGTAPQPISMLETITRLRDSGMSEEAIDAMDYEELVEARRQFSEPPVEPPTEDDGDEPGRDGDGENLTSAKNAVTDAEREAEGRDPILRDAIRANEGVVNGALQTLAVNPAAAEEVMERLAMTDHRGTVDDEAILLVEKVKQRRMRDAAGERASNPKLSPEARAVARREWDVIEETLNRIDHALSSIGTEAGRLLQFRTRMIADDFTLEAMERKERVIHGRPLTQDEAAKVKREWEAIAKRQKELDEAQAALDEAKVAAGVERTYKGMLEELQAAMGRPRKRGEKLLDTLRARAEASRTALAQMAEVANVKSGKQSGAVINPVAFVHLANIGAFHVANGAVKFADWLAKIKAEIGAKLFGEVEDSMPAVFDAAKAQHAAWEATDEAEPPRKAKAAPRKRGERAARPAKDADPSTPESVLEGIDPAKITHKDVYELAQAHVLAGLRGENEVMAAVHADLETIAPDLTERDVRRLFSDYGNVKFPSQDEDKRVLRELRVLVQLQESIDRMTEGLQAMKSGPQRDKATKEIREKRRRLNDLLKRSIAQRGHSPERMATFQEARKTNLRNQIEDLNEQLRTGVKPVRPGAPPPDAEVLRMREVRDALRVQLKALETPQERADRANAARAAMLKGQLATLENQLRTGVKPTRAEGPPADATVTALRGRIAALRAAIKAMEPESETEARFQQARAKALRTELEKVKARIAKGDYARYPRREPRALTKANEIAAFELAKVKNEFRRRQFEQEMAARPKWKKVVGGIAEVGNLTRALMTSIDFSAIGRQGWFIAAGHPIMAAKSIIPMFQSMLSEKAQFAIDEAITKRDNAALYRKHGLELTEHNNHLPTKMEEAFMSRWLDHVKPDPAAGFTKRAITELRNKLLAPVRGSQRGYTTFLNLLRADAFDAMAATLSKNDVLSKAEGDAIANYINVATGRGKIGKKNAGAQFLSNIFFAPRLVASRFNLLFGQPLSGGSARSKALIAAEYARFLAGTAVVYMLGALARSGEDDDDDRPFVESDPRSRNFGKMRFGNTYVDPLAGLAQTTTFATQMLTGEKKTAGKQEVQPLARYGRLSDVTGDQYGKKTPFWDDIAGVMTYFARTKLAPLPSALIDARTGYDVIGRETSPLQEARELVVPMSLRDVVKLTEQHGIPRGLAFTLVNMFGFGVQARDDADFNKPQK